MSTTHLPAGADLQTALNNARSGDVLTLERGASYQGNFVPPVRDPRRTVTVRTVGTLPNRRIRPTDPLATLVSGNNDPTLVFDPGACDWKFDAVNVACGVQEGIVAQDAARILLVRVLMVAGEAGQKRGIRGNGTNITLTRSHIANIGLAGQETQAFCAWDGAGPYTVHDNYLEAAGVNVLFGGANSARPENIPADIVFTQNTVRKQLAWKASDKVVKNLFELKSAKRVAIQDNTFEHNWTAGQPGYGIVFTVRNDEGGSPWSVVEDVLFQRNTVTSEKGLNILGYDSYQPSGQLTRIKICDSLLRSEQGVPQMGAGAGDIELVHVTALNASVGFAMLYKGEVNIAGSGLRPAAYAVNHLALTHSIGSHREYGVKADGGGMGSVALLEMARQTTWTNNVLAGANPARYPEGTLCPSDTEHEAALDADGRPVRMSPYRMGWGG